jgi:hypothetical protein
MDLQHWFYLAHPGAELMPPGEGEAEAHPVLLDERLQPLPGPAPLIQYHLTCPGKRRKVNNKIKLKSNCMVRVTCTFLFVTDISDYFSTKYQTTQYQTHLSTKLRAANLNFFFLAMRLEIKFFGKI